MADQATKLKSIANQLEGSYQALRRAAANIAGLLQLGKATCEEVRAYNLWALAIYNTQRGMLAALKAGGEQGVPDLPTYPTVFAWKGQSGEAALNISCDGSAGSLSGAMGNALRGPSLQNPFVGTDTIQIVTTDQYLYNPDKSPSFQTLLSVQAAQQQGAGVGVVGVVIAICAIAIAVSVGIAAIMHYLEVSKVQESNTEQVRQQAEAFANYTKARLDCYASCTQQGKSTDECVSTCQKLVKEPKIFLPGQDGKWGWLQWTGFTVVAGVGVYAAVKLFQRYQSGKPIFELPEPLDGPQLGAGADTNEYGLTFGQWLRAAEQANSNSISRSMARAAWKRGEDPVDWRPSTIAKYGFPERKPIFELPEPLEGLDGIEPGERVLPDPPSRSHGIQTKSEHRATIDVLRALSQTRQPDTSTILAWSPEMQDAFVRLSRAGYVSTDNDRRQWSRVRLTDAGKTYARQIDAT